MNQPPNFLDLLADLPIDILILSNKKQVREIDFIQLFVRNRSEIDHHLKACIPAMKQNGMLWICWPKKASGTQTDLNGNSVRETGLKKGLVDIKVCAINAIWSGLKFVFPSKDRI